MYLNDPESYVSGAWVLAGSPMLDRSKGKGQTKSDPPAPQVGVGHWTEKVFRYGNSNGRYQNNWI